jgi:hypothetical protein
MKKLAILAAFMACSLIGCEVGALAEEQFQKLSGAQIRAKLIGMEFTDQAHGGEVYEANGKLTIDDMGNKRVGTWRIQKDQLCTDLKGVGSYCFEVWMSGNRVQQRAPGSAKSLADGVLERPANHR